MKYILPILVIVLLLLFPQRVYCAQRLTISFIEYDGYGSHWFSQKEVPADSYLHLFARANAVLDYLFALDKPNIYAYPDGIQILRTHFLRGHLTVELYIPQASFGGTMLERIYLGQILKNLLGLDGVDRVSIIADTPEGLNVHEMCSWYELFDGIIGI